MMWLAGAILTVTGYLLWRSAMNERERELLKEHEEYSRLARKLVEESKKGGRND